MIYREGVSPDQAHNVPQVDQMDEKTAEELYSLSRTLNPEHRPTRPEQVHVDLLNFVSNERLKRVGVGDAQDLSERYYVSGEGEGHQESYEAVSSRTLAEMNSSIPEAAIGREDLKEARDIKSIKLFVYDEKGRMASSKIVDGKGKVTARELKEYDPDSGKLIRHKFTDFNSPDSSFDKSFAN